jgi:hypothetical protein
LGLDLKNEVFHRRGNEGDAGIYLVFRSGTRPFFGGKMTHGHLGFPISKLIHYFSMILAGVLGISFAGVGAMLLFSAFSSADHPLVEALFGLFFTVAGAGAVTAALVAFRRQRSGPSRSDASG